MESNYSNREFEQYVKQNADEYRMFPSERVWKGVHNTLHTRRRWSGFGLAFLLLLTGGAVTWVMTMYPVSKKQEITSAKPNQAAINPAERSNNEIATSPQAAIKKLLPFSEQPISSTATTNRSVSEQNTSLLSIISPATASPAELTAGSETASFPLVDMKQGREHPQSIINSISLSGNTAPTGEILAQNQPKDLSVMDKPTADLASGEKQSTKPLVEPANLLTIESIANTYHAKSQSKKVSWQLFITPTISYRKLSVNNSFDNSTGNGYPFSSLTDVNKAVTHKPDLGVQLGVMARIPVTKDIKLRGGLQFNINRYDIKAFAYNGEVATINLTPDGSPGTSSVSTWTRYRNYSGYHSDWLKNFYFSVSLPIGAELRLLGNDKTSIGIAGTIQPTYIISDRAYLISTDYKNYAKVPWLIRHVNVSTGFETFVNYTRGKTKWQIGPQVRYQMLSSFQNKYPVKENLFDFGVKIGVSINK